MSAAKIVFCKKYQGYQSEILSKKHVPYICCFNCKLIVKQTARAETKTKLTVGYENNDRKQDSVYSKRIKAGKRRTYFFDIKATRGNDYYLTITESRKRFNDDSYERHKIFLYKEDFNKFVKGLAEAVNYVKTELMPNFDFDAFNHEYPEVDVDPELLSPNGNGNGVADKEEIEGLKEQPEEIINQIQVDLPGNGTQEEVDKW